MSFSLAWRRFQTKTRDRLLHSRTVRQITARSLLSRVPVTSGKSEPNAIARSVLQLCRVARLSSSESFAKKVETEIGKQVDRIGSSPVDWPSLTSEWKTDRIEKAVVLKPWAGPQEPGVVLVSFDYQWPRLMGIRNLTEFSQRYKLVLAPTWSPPHCLETTLFPAQYPASEIYTLISNEQDLRIFPRLSSKFRAVPLYASNWVNPELYRSVPFAEKDIDIVMLAGFGTYKRHFALFEALRDLPAGLRVVLMGTASGKRTAAALHEEARAFGVDGRFELRESASDSEVLRNLSHAKVSLILSNQEGSCVAVVEAMFAGTPVGLYEDAIVGSKAFINERTGMLFTRGKLAPQLEKFLAAAATFAPREWALENQISCLGSTETLNRILKADALAAGEMWTQDIAVHHWRPDPVLLYPEDRSRLQPAYEDIQTRHGVALGPRPA